MCASFLAFFSGRSAPTFSPKGSAQGQCRGWLASGLFFRGVSFSLAPSLPPSFAGPLPPLGRREPPRQQPCVARSGEHFKASLARRLEEVYRQVPRLLPLSGGRWEGVGCSEVPSLGYF